MGKKQKTLIEGECVAQDLHATMLAQLGLKGDTKDVLKKTLGKNKRARAEDKEEEAEDSGAQEEYDDGKLTIGDLFTSIDRSKQGATN